MAVGIVLLCELAAAYLISRTVYRLWFHPLRKIPGPKLAAISHLYEFYYDVIKDGKYFSKLNELHDQYGPVVRFNPREVHIKDPYYYQEIYAGNTRRRNKDSEWVGKTLFSPNSVLTAVTHDEHRRYRGYIDSCFSKASLLDLEPMVKENVSKLSNILESAYHDNSAVQTRMVFSALTMDIITHFIYGKGQGALDDQSVNKPIVEALSALLPATPALKHFPWILAAARLIPEEFIQGMNIRVAPFIGVKLQLRKRAQEILAESMPKNDQVAKPTQQKSHGKLFEALVSPNVPDRDKNLDRLEEESTLLFLAGVETTARTLMLITFYLANNKEIMSHLRQELKEVMPTPTSPVSWTELEKLPYLTGVINEGLRLSYGPTVRGSRVSPTEPMVYKDLIIPPGTPVSQATPCVHHDPTIFPKPTEFDPERWIRAKEKGENLRKFLVSFSKGSRECIGKQLAYAELYVTLAVIARRFDLEPHETTVENITMKRDRNLPFSENGDFEVYFKVTGLVKD